MATRKAKNSTEVLKAVEWILENVGWTKFANFRNKDGDVLGCVIGSDLAASEHANLGSVCLDGAVRLVDTTLQLKVEALKLLDASVPKGFESAMEFNDSDKATKKKVLSVVKRAIKKGAK